MAGTRKIGLCLSGGLDSSILAYELNEMGVEDLVTLSIVYTDSDDGINDLNQLGFKKPGAWQSWKHKCITPPTLGISELALQTVDLLGHPTRMTSVIGYEAIAKCASEEGVTVLLCGEGADELFLGYPAYANLSCESNKTVWDGLRRLYFGSERLNWIGKLLGDGAVAYCESLGPNRWLKNPSKNPVQFLKQCERHLRLEPLLLRTDVTLMRHSIEGRTPYLHGIVPVCAHLCQADLGQKRMLREAWRKAIITSIEGRPKRHFRQPRANRNAYADRNDLLLSLNKLIQANSPYLFDIAYEPELRNAAANEDKDAQYILYILASLEASLKLVGDAG
jgi:asparagine synthase (glutamine-hydrolysing)